MSIIESKIKPSSEAFSDNKDFMVAQILDLQKTLATIETGGPESSRDKHKSRGKLLARDRVLGLIDKGSEFLELSALAAFNVYGEDVPAAG
ncbi:MAG: 3-methylcrotonyl-CoA carboxylase beta subunit, partial [Pseudohongiellaceae bacterium]